MLNGRAWLANDGQACYYGGIRQRIESKGSMTTYKVENNGLGVSFVWGGGAYIDIMFRGVAVSAWNVWDYADDLPTIARTEKALARYVAKRLKDKDEVLGIEQAIAETAPKYWTMAE